MSKTLQFPNDFPRDTVPFVPSITAMICMLRLYYWDELNENQRDIVLVAEQLAMKGEENAAYLRMVHKIYIGATTLSLLDKVKEFFRRFRHER